MLNRFLLVVVFALPITIHAQQGEPLKSARAEFILSPLEFYLDGGVVGDTRVVSKHWVDRCAKGDHNLYGKPYTDTCPNGAYSNFWWVDNIEKGDFMARGVFGQMIYINPMAHITIVKLSTWPDYQKPDFSKKTLLAFRAIREALSEQGI